MDAEEQAHLRNRNVLTENWFDEYGLSSREIREDANGRSVTELISLTRDEPDLSIFQAPNGDEVVTLEMEEVPCEPSPQSFIVSTPLSSPNGHR